MSIHICVCTTIDAATAVTWAAVERVETHLNWMEDAESIRFTKVARAGLGTEFECVTRIGPVRLRDKMSIVEWRPGESMGVVHRGLVTGTGRFDLTGLGDGRTCFCWEERLSLPLWMGGPIGERVAHRLLTRIWRGNLTRLKGLIEHDQAAAGRVIPGSGESSGRPIAGKLS